MQRRSIVLIALAAAANADILRRQQAQNDCSQANSSASLDCASLATADYLMGVCQPYNGNGQPDMNAPCNQMAAITVECVYGASGLQLVQNALSSSPGSASSTSDQNFTPLDNGTQRICICESQFFPAYTGCSDCFTAHGAPDISGDSINGQVSQDVISSASRSYCAATNTPTLGFYEAFASVAANVYQTSSIGLTAQDTSTSSFSDPIGNSTAVSYYYTPSITGSSAWVVAQATESASNGTASGPTSGSASSTPLNTNSAGQIVQTTASSASGSASGSASSTSSGSGAARTQEVAAVAGVIALAGFVAAW